MDEKLAIMQWLYENGVEPRMIWSPVARVFEINGEANKPCEDSFMLWLPWIPIEQILEELPRYITMPDNHPYTHATEARIGLQMSKEEFGYRSHAGNVTEDIVKNDYHLAALRLLKKVKEQSK